MKAEENGKPPLKALLQLLLAGVVSIWIDQRIGSGLRLLSGNWLFYHQLTQQGSLIADTWEESLLLLEVIDARPFKAYSGEGKKKAFEVWP